MTLKTTALMVATLLCCAAAPEPQDDSDLPWNQRTYSYTCQDPNGCWIAWGDDRGMTYLLLGMTMGVVDGCWFQQLSRVTVLCDVYPPYEKLPEDPYARPAH